MQVRLSRRPSREHKKTDGYLTIRIRRMAQQIVKQGRSTDSNNCQLANPLKKDHHLLVQITWICLICICLSLFAYQTYDRLDYYYTIPVVIDVFIKETNAHKFPIMTMCYQETKEMLKILNEDFPRSPCGNDLLSIITGFYPGYNTSYIWSVTNATVALLTASYIAKAASTNLSLSSVILPFGICTSFLHDEKLAASGYFEISFVSYISKCHDTANIFIFLHDLEENPMSRKPHTQAYGNKIEIGITSKQVSFLNRTKQPCITDKDYTKCREDCFINYLRKLNGSCGFPFYPKEVNLPSCVTGHSKSDTQLQSSFSYMMGMVEDVCVCPRKCVYRSFERRLTYLATNENQSAYRLTFQEPYDTFIQERICYDFINLLCDFGGNSGLYVGLSLLSIFEFVYMAANLRKKSSPRQYATTDPLFVIVSRTFNRLKRPKQVSPKINKWKRTWKTFYTICLCMLAFAVINRILYYFSNPTAKIVDVQFIEAYNKQPSLVICPGDERVMDMQQKVAKKKGKKFDPCEVKLWELLDIGDVNASHIWQNEEVRLHWLFVLETCSFVKSINGRLKQKKGVYVESRLKPFSRTISAAKIYFITTNHTKLWPIIMSSAL